MLTEDFDIGHGTTSIHVAFGSTEAAFASTADATGTMRWHASVLLGSLLAKTLACNDSAVIELGCGASLPSVVASVTGARSVLVTDAFPAAAELGLFNVSQNAPVSCSVSSAILEWGDADTARTLPRADVVLSSENLYVYRCAALPQNECAGEASALQIQAASLLGCARRVLLPGGIVIGVYTPRYRGMSEHVAGGAKDAGMCMRRIDSLAILTVAQSESLRFGRTRLFVAAETELVLDVFMSRHGLCAGPSADHESDSDSEDEAESRNRTAADLFE